MSDLGDFDNYQACSERQKKILELKLIGQSNEQIAKVLGLSVDELRREISEITKLLKKKNRKE